MSVISDKFFADKAVGALWDVAVSIKRGNPLPLDKDAVVHGIAELNALKTSPVTYPGQIVAVIEDAVIEEDVVVSPETTTLYYFDHELNYHEVGKVPVGDDVSVEVKDEVISLKDFGHAFYKYVAAAKDDEGNDVPAHYEKVEVSTSNPWKAGLEPKVVEDDGKLVLGWYEPNPTTIEGVNDQVSALQGEVTGIKQTLNGVPAEGETEAVKGLIERVSDAEGAIALKAEKTYVDTELGKKADKATTLAGYGINDAYTKEEIHTYVAEQVADASHLKRVIVDELPAVEEADLNTIYMIKVEGGLIADDMYEEYMLISVEGQDLRFEVIGSTRVDLKDYAKSADVYTKDNIDGKLKAINDEIGDPADDSGNAATGIYAELATKADKTDLETNYVTNIKLTESLSNKVTDTALTTALADYAKTADVNSELDKKADKSALEAKADKSELSNYVTTETMNTELGKKVDQSVYDAKMQTIDNSLNAKLDIQTYNDEKSTFATDEELRNAIGAPAEGETAATGIYANIYTKDEVDNKLSEKADASDVYTKEQANTLLSAKANSADVYTKTEADELLNAKANVGDAYTKTEANELLNAKANSADVYAKTDVYTKSEADAKIDEKIASVTGGESAADVKLALESYRDAINAEVWGPEAANWYEDQEIDGETVRVYKPQYGADTRIDKLEAVGAQANVIESITVENEALPIENKAVALPVATAAKMGLVKSAAVVEGKTADNSVSVDASGYMFVNSVNVNKLVQTEGEYLVLNGGAAVV